MFTSAVSCFPHSTWIIKDSSSKAVKHTMVEFYKLGMHHCFFMYQIDLEIVFPVGDVIDNIEPLIVFRWKKEGSGLM